MTVLFKIKATFDKFFDTIVKFSIKCLCIKINYCYN